MSTDLLVNSIDGSFHAEQPANKIIENNMVIFSLILLPLAFLS